MFVRRMLAVILAWVFSTTPLAGDGAGEAVLLEVKGPIGPATTDYITRGMAQAERDGAELVILRMNTPGGLDNAMRDIIEAIIASEVPVATWVAPSGARAASAGTFILYGSHVAAMAPATTLGAATPVQMGGGGLPGMDEADDSEEDAADEDAADNDVSDEAQENAEAAEGEGETKEPRRGETAMERKVLEDAVAYIRGLAELRERNADWAERAVRDAISASASEAASLGVIDFVARDVEELLSKSDGRTVQTARGEVTLATADLQVRIEEPDWRNELLSVLTNPNVAYVLMLLGIYGIIFELMNPGSLVPGVLGGISILLALYAFQALPISYAGVALIMLGIAFMVAEAFMPSFGIMGIGGVVAFVLGSILLMDTDIEAFQISIGLIAGFSLASLLVFTGIATMAVQAWRRPRLGGADELAGADAEAIEGFREADGIHRGAVHYAGERWQAWSRTPVNAGQRVRIQGKEGLRLEVSPEVEVSPETGESVNE